jgi:hypothetical protein
MNALELIDTVRSYDAELVVEENKLIVRGKGERLPDDVRAALKRHKAEILIALGVPYDVALSEILREIRPHLVPALQLLPDRQLIVLVNFSLMHALAKAVDEVARR